jgi:cob(I)alamin adenosyltransferase
VRPLLLRYLNRLSDVLWLLAREAEAAPGRRRAGPNPQLKRPRRAVR